MSIRTAETLASIYGVQTPPDDQLDPGVAARRAELRDLTGRGRKGNTQQQEEMMATELRERAEAMNLKDLRKVLTRDFQVPGASKLSKGDAVTAFVKANKPAKAARNGNSAEQTRVPSPIKWESADGQFTGQSPSANWNGSRYVIKNYLDTTKAKADDIKAGLKEAKAKLDAGAKSAKVLNVTIKVYDPSAA